MRKLAARLTLSALLAIAACSSPDAPAESTPPDGAGLERIVQDIRDREALQRANGQDNLSADRTTTEKGMEASTIAVELGPNERRTLVTDAVDTGSAEPARLFKICNLATTVVPINLDVYADPGAGPDHPSTERLAMEAKQCTFARGRKIEAWRSDDGSQEQAAQDEMTREASEWLGARIASLEAEVANKADARKRESARRILDEFKIRKSGLRNRAAQPGRVTVMAVAD